jgi:hypothetical protein
MKKKRNPSPIIASATADWKDIEGLAYSFTEALREFGICVCLDPQFEGSDQFGYIISRRPLTKAQYRKYLKDTFDHDKEVIEHYASQFDPETAYLKLYGIYYREREYARVMGDPELGRVLAFSKEHAERKAQKQGISGGTVGIWASLIK